MNRDASPVGHDIEKGLVRLLGAPRDLRPPDARRVPAPPMSEADSSYRQLFDRYVRDLDWALSLAIPWWNSLVDRRMREEDSTRVAALRANYFLRPAGPASRPEVVWIVRSYWLECARLNAAAPAARQIPPEVFLLEWLRVVRHDLGVSVLSGMPYWPIGLNEQGEYC